MPKVNLEFWKYTVFRSFPVHTPCGRYVSFELNLLDINSLSHFYPTILRHFQLKYVCNIVDARQIGFE